jgi:hypothetical protein
MLEDQGKLAAIRGQEDIRPSMPGRVERVIAHYGVVIGIVIDPNHGLADSNGDGERSKPIFQGHNDLPCRSMVAFGCILAKGVQRNETQQQRWKCPPAQLGESHKSPQGFSVHAVKQYRVG